MILRHIQPEERRKLLLTLIWGGMIGQELEHEIQRLLRVALVGIVIDADAAGADAATTMELLRQAVLAALDSDEWYDSAKTMAENNIALRDVVRAAKSSTEEIADGVDEFVDALGEERAQVLYDHFEQDVLPTFVVLADHIFKDVVAH